MTRLRARLSIVSILFTLAVPAVAYSSPEPHPPDPQETAMKKGDLVTFTTLGDPSINATPVKRHAVIQDLKEVDGGHEARLLVQNEHSFIEIVALASDADPGTDEARGRFKPPAEAKKPAA